VKKEVELWLWFIHDDLTGKVRVTRRRMTADDAEAAHPSAWRVPGSMERAEVDVPKDAELGFALDQWARGGQATTQAQTENLSAKCIASN
jgi:hypothetical protein